MGNVAKQITNSIIKKEQMFLNFLDKFQLFLFTPYFKNPNLISSF